MAAGVGVLGLEGPGQHLHALQEELLDPQGLLLHLPLQVLLVVAVLQHQRPLLQHPRDPGLQLAHRDRLEQEVGRAAVEAVHRGGRLAHAAEHDDRGVGVPGADHLEQADAVELGHAHVRDDERGLADPVEHLERLQAAAGLEARGSPGPGASASANPTDTGLVIHDEAVGGAGHDRLRVLECRHG